MSAQHNRKCDRVDRRMAEAKQLLEMWATNTLEQSLLCDPPGDGQQPAPRRHRACCADAEAAPGGQ